MTVERPAAARPPCRIMFHVKHPVRPRRLAIRIPSRPSRLAPLMAAAVLLGAACSGISRPKGWAAPELDNSTLYVTLEHGKLDAYRLGDQQQRLWQFPAGNEKLPLAVENGKNLPTPKSEKITFEGFYGNPVVTDTGVYITGYSGHVVGLDTSGNARWVDALPGRLIGGALVAGDSVYAGTTDGHLFALARDTGLIRWQRSVGKDIWSTPAAVDDLVVVSDMDGHVLAFDHDGNQRWDTDVSGAGIASTPAVSGNRLYVGAFDKRIYALDATTGAVIWKTPELDNWFWTDILVQGDTLYAGSLGGWVYALAASDGSVAWKTNVGEMVKSRPALVDGVLVVGSKDGRLHGLDPKTGALVWNQSPTPTPDSPAAARGDLFADLLPADNKNGVYFSTEQGNLYFLDVPQQKVSEVVLK